MLNNDLSHQGEAADSAPTSNQPPSSSSSLQPAVMAGGDPNALRRAPPIPIFHSPFSNGLPLTIFAASGPGQLTIDAAGLAEVVESLGDHAGARAAAIHHYTVNPVDPPSVDELLTRVLDARQRLKPERFDEFEQGAPNAVAVRLLAPRAGPSYPFDREKTSFTKPNGTVVKGRKCGDPTCEYRGTDRRRHTQEMHVKDIATALCCPLCEHVYYDTSRDSEMRLHLRGHGRRNANAQRQALETSMSS